MRNQVLRQLAGGLVAASLAVAMAPAPEAREVAAFVNDRGELMTVDPPSSDRKPAYVAIPLRNDAEKAATLPSANATPLPKR